MTHQAGMMDVMGAYFRLQASKPQSLAWLGASNPVGQAAWIAERFHDWSDLRTKSFEAVYSKDRLLTNIMLYVMTDSFATGAWYYRGMLEEGGVALQPGTLALLEQAVRDGAEVIGGLDPIGMDRDPQMQLDGIFDIAGRLGCAIDIHLHDRGDMGALTIEMIAERCAALGLRGKVAISHAFCLGMLEPARLDGIIRLLLDQDMAVMTHAPSGPTPFPPVRLLHECGVRLFTGSDGVRDAWSPLNNGDMLERAYLIAYRCGFRDDAGIELALDMATHGGARVMGVDGYGLHVGAVADLVLVPAETPSEAVVLHPPRRLVIKRGKIVASDGH